MSRRLPVILLLVLLPLWLAASYGARYGFMEDGRWVGICVDEASRWECTVRSNLGLMIHFKVLGWTALGAALLHSALRKEWLTQDLDSRALGLTPKGRKALVTRFGIQMEDR